MNIANKGQSAPVLKIVFKYELSHGVTELVLPAYARILSAQIQRGKIQLWALALDGQTCNDRRRFIVVGTGQPIEEPDIVHISTIQTEDQNFVWHVFEID